MIHITTFWIDRRRFLMKKEYLIKKGTKKAKKNGPEEMDSSVERGLSGELLDNQDHQLNDEGTIPRLNTKNL